MLNYYKLLYDADKTPTTKRNTAAADARVCYWM